MRTFTKKQKVAAAFAAAMVAGSGTAYAYWSTTGSGTGTAATSAGAANLTVTQTAAPTNLYPGAAAGAITGTVRNNAENAAYVTQVMASIASVTKAANAPAGTCDASDYVLSNAAMAVGKDLASGATEAFSGATLAFNNKTSNQDACKGATVNLAYAAS